MEKEMIIRLPGNDETIAQLEKIIVGLRDGSIHVSDLRIDNRYARGERFINRDIHIDCYEMMPQ
jgi:hypothetical protein